MRDLKAIANECMEELDSIGIPYGVVVEWKINTRAQRRWGQCRRMTAPNVRGPFYSININVELLKEENSIDGLKNTIIHELLHTCDGCMAHNAMWNKWASKVYRELGYNIKRTSSDEEKGLSSERSREREEEIRNRKISRIKYKVICNDCGSFGYYQRATKFIQNPSMYRCGKCGGRFTITGCNGWDVLGLNPTLSA